jgi:hypothetical protein
MRVAATVPERFSRYWLCLHGSLFQPVTSALNSAL